MNITGDMIILWLAIMLPIMGFGAFIWNKLDQIWKTINQMIDRDTCQSNRDRCPCVKDISETRFRVAKLEDGK